MFTPLAPRRRLTSPSTHAQLIPGPDLERQLRLDEWINALLPPGGRGSERLQWGRARR